jgi:hypothetical protein
MSKMMTTLSPVVFLARRVHCEALLLYNSFELS